MATNRDNLSSLPPHGSTRSRSDNSAPTSMLVDTPSLSSNKSLPPVKDANEAPTIYEWSNNVIGLAIPLEEEIGRPAYSPTSPSLSMFSFGESTASTSSSRKSARRLLRMNYGEKSVLTRKIDNFEVNIQKIISIDA